MLQRLVVILSLLYCCGFVSAQTMTEYEYWIDDNVAARTNVKSSNTSVNLSINLKDMQTGVHYLNFRAKNSDGIWGSFSRFIFFAPEKKDENVTIQDYQYWLDDDFANKVTVKGSSTTIQAQLNISSLSTGVHYFNFRAKNSSGDWGALTRYIFVVQEPRDPNVKIKEYEYWIDDNFEAKVSVKTSSTDIPFTVDISKLHAGTHYLNFRARNTDGVWGALTRYSFMAQPKQDENVAIKMYEYWVDDDCANKKRVSTSQTNIQFSVNIAELTDGVHYLNFRALNTSNTWGALTRYIFLKSKETGTSKSPIVAYRYSFGGTPTYVNVTPTTDLKLENLAIPIPSSSEYGSIDENCEFTFNGDNVKLVRGAYVNFNIQFLNQVGAWSVPYCDSMYLTDIVEHQANALDVQSTVTYDKTSQGDYCAFKSTITSAGTYYFKANQPCKISLYKQDGTLVKTFASNELLNVASISLSAGTYYGIVHSMLTNEQYDSDQVTIRLMVTNGCVPTPTISFSNCKATISCLQNGALIYYTIDGTNPTTQSAQYTGSFDVLRNCTIKALATYEDLEPSDIATYKVNTYKVENPVITFANLQLYMTCSTPNSAIFYTLDGRDPNTYGVQYSGPVSVSSSCTAKAVAKREGYNNSDIITYVFDDSSVTCPMPTISFSNGRVTINCLQDGAKVYYTTNGTTPTTSSTLYNGTFNVDENCTIKAIAAYEGFLNSAVAEYKIDSYKVATPVIAFANLQVHITCSTSNASIYYTLDGNDPKTSGTLYTAPVSVTQNCTVKAIAKRNNYHDSDVATYNVDADSYTCPKPTFTLINNTLKIECLESGSKIRYTVDSTTPSSTSAVYTSPITLEHNCVVKAYAEKSGYINSQVASYTVDWFQTEMPSFSFSGGYLTISSSTPGAKIYYTIGGSDLTQSSTLYTSPIKLTDNRQVRARAYADNFNPSDVAVYDPNSFTCEEATILYNGRYVELEASTEGARIYYTTDGTNPSTRSNEYHSQFDAGGICTIRALVVKEAMNNSNVTLFEVPVYYDGECATIATAGSLEQGFGWCDTNEIEKIEVRGTINANDLNTLSLMPSIKHIDLSTVSVENNSIPSRAFANMPIVSILMPQSKSIKTVGNSIFDGCKNLAAIQWNPYIPLTSTAMTGIDNPNLLLYVSMKNHAPSSIRNVVVEGTAENIVLTDGQYNNFYCPIGFRAKRISYTHTYTQKTIVGECAGWETLALPFDVKSIRHSRVGEIAPFAADNAEAKPFWLYALSVTGFEPASAIEANTPYVISMPNNDSYADDYLLAGDVTFSAENIDVEVTTQNIAQKGLVSFIPTTLHVGKSQDVYAINKHEPYDGINEGSMFVIDLRNISPFEGYWSLDGGAHRVKAFGVFDVNDFSYELPIVTSKYADFNAYTIDNVLYIETNRAQRVDIFTMSGMLIRNIDVEVGTTKVLDLIPGFYIVNNVKVIIQ